MLIQKRLKEQSSVGIIPDQVILHSLANGYNWEGGVNWLRSPTNALESHYAVRADGLVVQLVEESQRAEANYKANRRPNGHGAISIETDSSISATEPWTDAQVESLVELVADICRRHNIPARLCPAWDQAGIGWHIMFGTPGMWTPVSKSCPGPARIRQVKDVIVPRVKARLAKLPEGNNPTPISEKPSPEPTPDPAPPAPVEEPVDEDDMIRLVKLDGDPRRLCADFGARTYWHVGRQDQYNWLRDNLGVPELDGEQAPFILDGFRELEPAGN